VVETLTKRCNELASLIEAQEKRFDHLETLLNTVSCAEIELRMNAFYPINVPTLTIQGDTHLKMDKMSILYKLQKIVFTSFSFSDLSCFKNGSLREMTIDSSSKMSSLKGLEGFPNLEVLSIANSPLLKDFSAFYKLGHKIKRLNVQQPSQELQMFCTQHQIALT
jgi:hypothetical protein